MSAVNEKHKDRLFRFIFGREENREWTLSLYNAMNNSHYEDPNAIEFNTIEDAIYLGMKNDVSFIIMDEINLWEHQSSFNPNMPVRFFLYAAQLYEKYLTLNNIYIHGRTLKKLPSAKCFCFYNGTEKRPEKEILKLSNSFSGESDIELHVTMLNVNYGKNKTLMNACEPLREYSWFVDAARQYEKTMGDLEKAVDVTINEMPEDFAIKKFLVAHKAEVKRMFLTEYDEKKVLQFEREEGREETKMSVAMKMLREKLPLSLIEKISSLSADAIRGIAEDIGVNVVS